jgi:hypothetical protein
LLMAVEMSASIVRSSSSHMYATDCAPSKLMTRLR